MPIWCPDCLVPAGISIYTVALMSVDRAIYVKKPHIVTSWRMFSAIVVVWLVSIVVSALPLFGFGRVEFSHIIGVCSVFLYDPSSSSVLSYFIVVIVLAAIATMVQLFGCGCIIYITRKHLLKNLHRLHDSLRSRTQRGRNSEDSGKDGTVRSGIVSNYRKSQLQLVKVFGAIVSASLLTLIPLIIAAIGASSILGSVPIPIYSIAYLSALSRSVIHPILEAYMTHDIRQVIAKFCRSCAARCIPCRHKDVETE